MQAATAIRIVRAAATELRQTLKRSLAAPQQSPVELEQHVTTLVEYCRVMGLDLSRQWLAVLAADEKPTLDPSTPRSLAACTCIESPGRTALLLLPIMGGDHDSALHDAGRAGATPSTALRALVAQCLSEQAARDCRLVQVMLMPGPGTEATAGLLLETGFIDIAELVYMERTVGPVVADSLAPLAPGSAGGSSATGGHVSIPVAACLPNPVQMNHSKTAEPAWETYCPANHAAFADLICRTYEQSRDCPGLSGLRNIEDILEGHKAAGLFHPGHWLLAKQDGEPIGCILMSRNPLQLWMEIVYMGVVPDHRGRGVGAALIRRGLALAQHEGMQKVTLAVDGANDPAVRLYARFGFTETARRRALVCPLVRRSSPSSD